MNKKFLLTLLIGSLVVPLSSCSIHRVIEHLPDKDANKDKSKDNEFDKIDFDKDLPDLDNAARVEEDGVFGLKDKDYRLMFVKDENNEYHLEVTNQTKALKTFISENPIDIAIKEKSTNIIDTMPSTHFKGKYSSLEMKDYGYELSGTITSKNGSIFTINDAYFIKQSGAFGMSRKVEVTSQDETNIDDGFASYFELNTVLDYSAYTDFTYFMPSVLYKDEKYIAPGGIATKLDIDEYLLVKETRTGLPLSMLRHTDSGESMGLSEFDIHIDVGENIGGGVFNEVNNDLKYSSIGYNLMNDSFGVAYAYPCYEAPFANDGTGGKIARYHTVKTGFQHGYKLAIIPGSEETHNDQTVSTYITAFQYESPEVKDIDMEEFYSENIYLLREEYREFGGNYGGFPYSIDNHTNAKSEGYSSQMGFVGQQIPLGYNMIRSGRRNSNLADVQKGQKIINFWSSLINDGDYFPVVWWQPETGQPWKQSTDGWKPYAAFLRCMVDGAEGIIDAYRVEKAYGYNNSSWKDAIIKIADNLIAKQNTDGSFNRAYDQQGNIKTEGAAAYCGDSKLNTPEAIRFLGKVYDLTGEEKYKTSALEAAQYSYTEIYEKLGKYIGGTADNPNYLDKEGAIYAMYGFIAAYQLSKDTKYLRAAKHAAVCSISWMYVFDFAVPSDYVDDKYNVFKNGGAMGFSFIMNSNGSGADNFSSFSSFSLYCVYVLSGDEFFKQAAIVTEKATKYCSNYDGRMSLFKYKALCPEATGITAFTYSGSAARYRWLAWCAAAFIVPLSDMKETFGEMNISDIRAEIGELRQTFAYYGCGGKEMSV